MSVALKKKRRVLWLFVYLGFHFIVGNGILFFTLLDAKFHMLLSWDVLLGVFLPFNFAAIICLYYSLNNIFREPMDKAAIFGYSLLNSIGIQSLGTVLFFLVPQLIFTDPLGARALLPMGVLALVVLFFFSFISIPFFVFNVAMMTFFKKSLSSPIHRKKVGIVKDSGE